MTSHAEILGFIYERMMNVHGEKERIDYMLKFKEAIDHFTGEKESPAGSTLQSENDALKKQLADARSRVETLDRTAAWTCILCGQSYSIPYVVGVDGKRSHARCWAKNFYRDEKAEEDLASARAEIVLLKGRVAELEPKRGTVKRPAMEQSAFPSPPGGKTPDEIQRHETFVRPAQNPDLDCPVEPCPERENCIRLTPLEQMKKCAEKKPWRHVASLPSAPYGKKCPECGTYMLIVDDDCTVDSCPKNNGGRCASIVAGYMKCVERKRMGNASEGIAGQWQCQECEHVEPFKR